MKAHRVLAIIFLDLLILACAASPADRDRPDPEIETADCEAAQAGQHFIEYPMLPPREGARIQLRPRRLDGPFGFKDVPLSCTSDWRSSNPAAASVGRTGLLSIAENAGSGTEIIVATRVGEALVELPVRIVGRDEPSPVGRWVRVLPDACASQAERQPGVAALRMTGTRYSYTTYEGREFAGTYSFDPVGGAISFEPFDALQRSQDADRSGTATVGESDLVLEEVAFPDPWIRPAAEDCPLRFQRAPS